MAKHHPQSFWGKMRSNIFLGLFTLIPIWLTLLLVSVVLSFINDMAAPVIAWVTSGIEPTDALFAYSRHPLLRTALSLALLVATLYGAGWFSSRWLGKKLLQMVEHTLLRIPFANTIYKTIKQLADAMQTTTDEVERVVLIEFPSPSMKTVGLVTRTFKDTNTGRELAAVYVPTTPNPTSGYLEIVPVENLTPTNWRLDEAMSFIISGGADVPNTFYYDKATAVKEAGDPATPQPNNAPTHNAQTAKPPAQP